VKIQVSNTIQLLMFEFLGAEKAPFLFVINILKGKTTPFKIAGKVIYASRNGKGAVAFKNGNSNRLSDAFSFMDCSFRA